MEKKIILPTDPEAATFRTDISGWVDIYGRFWGKDEKTARYASSTHSVCECGNTMSKGWSKCESCRGKTDIKKYNKLQFKEWRDEIVYSELCDKYFRDSDEIEDYCSDEDIDIADLRLVLCEPNYFQELNEDQWDDVLPEESDGELPNKLIEAIGALNEVIKSLPPASYSPGRYRTSYTPQNAKKKKEN